MADDTRKGDWMQTAHGRKFWPVDPRPEDIHVDDIAHALSLMCRFGGHCRTFYSVAEHSVRVSLLFADHDPMLALAALLHDAAEAYVVDIPRPLKRSLAGYAEIEGKVAECVSRRFDLETGILEHPSIKHADETLLATEARDIMGGESAGKWCLRARALRDKIEPWTTEVARGAFLGRFAHLTVGR